MTDEFSCDVFAAMRMYEELPMGFVEQIIDDRRFIQASAQFDAGGKAGGTIFARVQRAAFAIKRDELDRG